MSNLEPVPILKPIMPDINYRMIELAREDHLPDCSGGESCSCGSRKPLQARERPLVDLLTRASLTQMEVDDYD